MNWPTSEVELRPNPRSKFPCDCGADRPTVRQIVINYETKIDCCLDCVEQRWAEKRLFA